MKSELDFTGAYKLIQKVDNHLEALLRVVWQNTSEMSRQKLTFCTKEYPFSSYVLKNGKALNPRGLPFREDFLLRSRVPFGLIIQNRLEVVDELIQYNEVLEMPQAILYPKQIIGVFELLDDVLHVAGRPVPDWTIASGSRSLKFVDFPTQKAQWHRLRARYKAFTTFEKSNMKNLREVSLLEIINDKTDIFKKWNSKIIFFHPAWFEEIDKQLYDAERSVPAAELLSYFKDSGWSSLARVRDRAVKLEDAINELGGDTNSSRCKAAYLLLRYSMDILTQRRPSYIPLDNDLGLGPINQLKDALHRVAKINDTILAPRYLENGEVGFLSLSLLAPSAFNSNPADNLEDILKIIGRSLRSATNRGLSVQGLTNAPEIFSKLTFRVKSGRERASGRHGSILTYKVKLTDTRHGDLFEKHPVGIEEFYAPYFGLERFPPSDSRFFRVSVRLEPGSTNAGY